MKYFVVVLLVAEAVLQVANSQCLRQAPVIQGCLQGPIFSGSVYPSAPLVAPGQILPQISLVGSESVANNLADTLSLLTVSSLLAETLPYGCTSYAVPNALAYPAPVALPSPVAVPTPLALPAQFAAIGGCGCGCGANVLGGCGCNGLGAYFV